MSGPTLLPDRYKEGSYSAKTLYIIRHGETDLNKRGIVQGRGMDTDLNAYGYQQASAFYEKYKQVPFDKIYTSTLKRTHQTVGSFIDSGIPWTQHAGFDELAWGIHEGQESSDITKKAFREMIHQWMQGGLHRKFEQGESPLEVRERQLEALDHVIKSDDEKVILICMHGRAMRLFLCLLTEVPLTKMDAFPHFNTSLYKVHYDGFKFQIVDFNNLAHLKDLR
ncbi:MAG: histidine phosphatase family protein [Sphingobacteriaceae bacterium]|nr:MAG: histidine phosphatase family protein [Pedobacter sp.]